MARQHRLEELRGSCDVASFRHVHVDDLAVLIHGPVHVAPHTGDLDVGLVDEPAVTDAVTTRPRRVDEQRCEALHPPVDGDVIDLDAAFGEEFLDVAVRQAVAEVPAHGQQDHLGREPVPGKRRRLRTATTIHPNTLRPAPDPSTQQCPRPIGNGIRTFRSLFTLVDSRHEPVSDEDPAQASRRSCSEMSPTVCGDALIAPHGPSALSGHVAPSPLGTRPRAPRGRASRRR